MGRESSGGSGVRKDRAGEKGTGGNGGAAGDRGGDETEDGGISRSPPQDARGYHPQVRPPGARKARHEGARRTADEPAWRQELLLSQRRRTGEDARGGHAARPAPQEHHRGTPQADEKRPLRR